jgi:deoxycitidine kinase/deoxyguanosine kinase
MLYEKGIIDKINYDVYLRWYNEFQKDMLISGIIYVNTNVENSYKRIKIRNRKGEENITKDYLQKLDDYHKEWLYSDNLGSSLLKIDGNIPYENKLPDNWREDINTFIKNNVTDLNNDGEIFETWFDENFVFF